MTEDAKIALQAMEDLQAGSAKLASMVEELQSQVLSPEEQQQLAALNTQIVSKLAAAGHIQGMSQEHAVQSLMHPVELASVLNDLLPEVPTAGKEAAAPLNLGGRVDNRKQAEQPAPRVVTSHRKQTRC